jgi:NAD-dependent deacetylase
VTTDVTIPAEASDLLRGAERVTVLTGAGISAESGIPTFRDAQAGLWARFDAAQLATEGAFRRDPAMVWGWYLWRVGLEGAAEPNDGHRAVAALADRAHVDVVTQNVDSLHERAGSTGVTHLHGSLTAYRCLDCGQPHDADVVPPTEPMALEPPTCAECGGWIRPGVVWFGEALPSAALEAAVEACTSTDVVLVVGTSGLVHPAAGLPALATERGIPTIEVNPSETALSGSMTHVVRAPAAVALPLLLRG